ncbi:hypothetical protein CHS0354_002063 [Potamilus streckersoni]|uniref:Uncharacterized protein n=1 Tax=Potamilus streckersoni TaxID=2493646 RepID=A0AAE0T6N2_9BIVA|nr:hypothetical protein CHS0354_002063 [Potamilus streckersoni]
MSAANKFRNQLYYGDNLTIMRAMPDDSVDLIYLDPPFNSKRNYNIVYKTMTGKPVPEQVEAFCDTWEMDAEKEDLMKHMPEVLSSCGADDRFIQFWNYWCVALRHSQPTLLAYMLYMTVRLAEMKRILKPTGSLYLHCDPTASHYIKVMMDGIFGQKNFRNEIIWKRQTAKKGSQYKKRTYGTSTDTIFFYTKSDDWYFEIPKTIVNKQEKRAKFNKTDTDGRNYRLDNILRNSSLGERPNLVYEYKGYTPDKPGWMVSREKLEQMDSEGRLYWSESGRPYRKYFADEYDGKEVSNVWTDIFIASAKERLGYPTQKPIALLERIITASCPKNGVVFDPFCGCGTTVCAAHLNNRKWIGCDIAILSVRLIQEVLLERYGLVKDRDYKTDGIPTSVEGARMLFEKDPFQFQNWCIEYTGGFCNNKKTADRGIDGRIYFHDADKIMRSMLISVKGGKTGPADVRDLRGTLERDEAQMAGLICIQEPTKAMQTEAEAAGFYELSGTKYRRVQLLTIKDMVEDKKIFHVPNQAGVASGVGLAVLSKPVIAQGTTTVKWRMASSFPKNLDTIFGAADTVAKRVSDATGGKFQIQVFAAGELFPGPAVLDAVKDNTVEMGHTAMYYFIGKDPTFAFDTAIPFGLNSRQQTAWMMQGGGLQLMRDFFKEYKITSFPTGNTGTQMGGWLRKEIKTVKDLEGLKFRVGGFAGQVMQKLGVVPQQIPGGDIYPALEKGTIDAAEWVGPYDDEKLGFNKVAKYYYYPGWWEGGAQLSTIVNIDQFNKLPKEYQVILEDACAYAHAEMQAKYDARNIDALKRLAASGTQITAYPDAVLKAAYDAAFQLYDEISKTNAKFKKVYEPWNKFRKDQLTWFGVAEDKYDTFVQSMHRQKK